MKFGVITFPGSNCDRDLVHVIGNVLGQEVKQLWHKEQNLDAFTPDDCIFVPGGFSYGDYLRPGAIASFSPIMQSLRTFAENGGLVWGICNGFQILCEMGLLPGVLLRNQKQKFYCNNVFLKTISNKSKVSNQLEEGQVIKIPVAHADGRFHIDKEGLADLEANDQILFKYCEPNGQLTATSNFNGSVEAIAAIRNKEGNVFGMMPHPERASEAALDNIDGLFMFNSILQTAGVA